MIFKKSDFLLHNEKEDIYHDSLYFPRDHYIEVYR